MQFQYVDQPSMGCSRILQKITNSMNLTAECWNGIGVSIWVLGSFWVYITVFGTLGKLLQAKPSPHIRVKSFDVAPPPPPPRGL